MKVIKPVLVASIFVFVMTSLCSAEPTPTVSYLINTPTSVFDFGMYRLQVDLNTSYRTQFGGHITLIYIWPKNKILIRVSAPRKRFDEGEKEAKLRCKEIINLIKSDLSIDTTTGQPLEDEGSLVTFYFSHMGYQLKSEPKNLYEELDNITEIWVHTSCRKNGKTKFLNARAPLLGTDIFFSEKIKKPRNLLKDQPPSQRR